MTEMSEDIECSFSLSTKSENFFVDFESDRIPFFDDEDITKFLEYLYIIRMVDSKILVDVFGLFEVTLSLIERAKHEIEITVSLIECESLDDEDSCLCHLSSCYHGTDSINQCEEGFIMILNRGWILFDRSLLW